MQNVIVDSQGSDDNNDDPEKNYCTPGISEAVKDEEVLNMFVQSNFGDDNMESISRLHNSVLSFHHQTKTKQKQSKLQTFCYKFLRMNIDVIFGFMYFIRVV